MLFFPKKNLFYWETILFLIFSNYVVLFYVISICFCGWCTLQEQLCSVLNRSSLFSLKLLFELINRKIVLLNFPSFSPNIFYFSTSCVEPNKNLYEEIFYFFEEIVFCCWCFSLFFSVNRNKNEIKRIQINFRDVFYRRMDQMLFFYIRLYYQTLQLNLHNHLFLWFPLLFYHFSVRVM